MGCSSHTKLLLAGCLATALAGAGCGGSSGSAGSASSTGDGGVAVSGSVTVPGSASANLAKGLGRKSLTDATGANLHCHLIDPSDGQELAEFDTDAEGNYSVTLDAEDLAALGVDADDSSTENDEANVVLEVEDSSGEVVVEAFVEVSFSGGTIDIDVTPDTTTSAELLRIERGISSWHADNTALLANFDAACFVMLQQYSFAGGVSDSSESDDDTGGMHDNIEVLSDMADAVSLLSLDEIIALGFESRSDLRADILGGVLTGENLSAVATACASELGESADTLVAGFDEAAAAMGALRDAFADGLASSSSTAASLGRQKRLLKDADTSSTCDDPCTCITDGSDGASLAQTLAEVILSCDPEVDDCANVYDATGMALLWETVDSYHTAGELAEAGELAAAIHGFLQTGADDDFQNIIGSGDIASAVADMMSIFGQADATWTDVQLEDWSLAMGQTIEVVGIGTLTDDPSLLAYYDSYFEVLAENSNFDPSVIDYSSTCSELNEQFEVLDAPVGEGGTSALMECYAAGGDYFSCTNDTDIEVQVEGGETATYSYEGGAWQAPESDGDFVSPVSDGNYQSPQSDGNYQSPM